MSSLREAFLVQAEVCADLGSQMYADLSVRIADDLEAEGISASVLAGSASADSAQAVPLRLLGSVHRLVLERRAGALAAFYPSVGGRWEPVGGWEAFCALLEEQPALVAEWLDRPPQTNEVGRSAALMGGLLALPAPLRMPVRLFEIGASAGLNLLADHYAFTDQSGQRFGSAKSDALLFEHAWTGQEMMPWPDLQISERAGCDVRPIDPRTIEGRLSLTAYVWADQLERFDRLRRVLATAQRHPVTVLREPAAEFVAGLGLATGTTTVIWHSVMWQYLDSDEQQSIEHRIQRLGAQAAATSPLVRLFFEPTARIPQERGIVVTTWSGGEADGQSRLIGTAPPHGLPITWN